MNSSSLNAYSYTLDLAGQARDLIYPLVSLSPPQNETAITLFNDRSVFLLFASENDWEQESFFKTVSQKVATLGNEVLNWIQAASRPALGHFSLALLYAQIKGSGINSRTIGAASQIAKKVFITASLAQWASVSFSANILSIAESLSQAYSLGHIDSLSLSKIIDNTGDWIIYSAIQYVESWIPYSPLSTMWSYYTYFSGLESPSHELVHSQRTTANLLRAIPENLDFNTQFLLMNLQRAFGFNGEEIPNNPLALPPLNLNTQIPLFKIYSYLLIQEREQNAGLTAFPADSRVGISPTSIESLRLSSEDLLAR